MINKFKAIWSVLFCECFCVITFKGINEKLIYNMTPDEAVASANFIVETVEASLQSEINVNEAIQIANGHN